jgi:hypothetical protein
MAAENSQVVTMLSAATTAAAGAAVSGARGVKTFQADGTTSAGSGSATIQVQGRVGRASWDVIGTITLTLGTTATSDSFTSDDRYTELRGNVTAISGTNASVNLYYGR